MRIAAGTPLAVHVYVLDVVKGEMRFQYAAIAEIHHPDYLRRDDLSAIYGSANAQGHEALVAAMLAVARAKTSE